jgi:methyl-accepting chemotaxis protein
MIANEKKELRNKMDLAYNILEMYYKKTTPQYMEDVVKKSLISHQEQLFHQLNKIYTIYKTKESPSKLKKRLLEIIKYSRYGKNGYFWVNDMDYKMIMHPIKPTYDSKTFIDTPLVPFIQLGVDTLKKEKKSSTYIKYQFYNPASKKYEFKVSLVQVFKPYNWVIGTGKYLSDVTPMIQVRALKDIEALRYGQNGYFWVNNMQYKMIMHPIKPEYDNNTFINTPNVPFVQLGVDALNNTTKKCAIIRYSFHNPATGEYEDKLSVVKIFKPWNWVLGTGVYLDGIKNSVQEVTKNKKKEENNLIVKILLISTSILFVVLLLTYYLVTRFIIHPMQSLNTQKEYFEEIAQIDFLTNILNRRAFHQEIEKYFAYAQRDNIQVSVMMLDIDFFKKVNDTYGHDAGDFVLKTIASIIKDIIREEDIFGRLGGEEFGICILNSSPEALCKIANKIRKSIETKDIFYNDTLIKITMSIGGYNLFTTTEDFKMAFDKADKALYKSKDSGRNKVTLYDLELC